ncbi:MAG: trypsin-like peptidase domain-containing protein [Spirochaetes bacterium]|nr:trypsin-like peptidase domain-containing protein [Spirochaetota bacterium]
MKQHINNFYKIFILVILLIIVILLLFVIYLNINSRNNFVKGLNHKNNANFEKFISNTTDRDFDNDEKNTINIYDNLSSSVVNITFYKTEYVRYFFELYPQTSEGQGSGAIIDKRGFVITNYHVIGNADKLTVSLSKEEGFYDADIIGIDPENDLAVIKIKNFNKDFNIIPLGDSNNLKVGQKVYAIGNPFGLDRTLTTGIISGLGRPIKTESGSVIEGAIQTDASINPGNSGGPLINSSGRMIGINTMIISPSGGSVGLGFAIPINTVKDVLDELIKYGYVKRGWFDASFLPMSPILSRELGYPVDYGLMIMTTKRNGEAYKAGLRGGEQKAIYKNKIIYIGGELLVKVNDMKINDYSSLVQVLKNKKPGEIVKVEYYKARKKYTANIRLIDKKDYNSEY